MPTLVLIRHAKAVPTHPRGDHERELADRGRRDAAALGAWLTEADLLPDLALVSTAARARQTLEAVLPADDLEVWTTRRIYDGGLDGVAGEIAEVPDEVEVLWVVGHEPVMSSTAWELADHARLAPDLREELAGGLPTASAAVLELEVPWAEVGLSCARLVRVHTGRA